MELCDPVQQLVVVLWTQVERLQVLAAVTMDTDIVVSELRLSRERAEQRQRHERTRQPVNHRPTSRQMFHVIIPRSLGLFVTRRARKPLQ